MASEEMKLTEDVLMKLGFRGEGRDIINKPAYRLIVPKGIYGHYHYQFQIVLGDYPENNGNSGVLSLYSPSIKDAHMIAEEDENLKVDFVLWEVDNDGKPEKGGIKYVDIKERIIPIAWHITTLERLNKIYTAITGNDQLEIIGT